MPQVGNKKFPYTPSGMKRAQQAMKRQQNPVASAIKGFQNRQRFAGALDSLRSQSTLRRRAKNLSPMNQARVDAPNQRVQQTPNRRQQIVGQVKQDKMYRPSDGPKAPNVRLAGAIRPGGVRRPKPPARPRPFPPRGPNKRLPWRGNVRKPL